MAIFGQNKKRHQYNKILLFIAFCCCSVLTQFNHACLTYTLNSSKHGNITYTTKTLLPAKSSEIALKNSGRPLTISLMAFAIYGVITGVDITPLLYHGAWLANAQNIPALNVNYTFCQSGTVKTKNSVTKATCPCDLSEKFFTHYSREYGIFACRFGLAEAKGADKLDTADPTYRNAMLLDTTIGYFSLVIVLLILRLPFLIMYRNHYGDDIDAAADYKYCGKCPQNKIPCFPIRYWMDIPNVTLKLTIGLHMGLTFAAFSGVAAYFDTGDLIGLLIAIPLLIVVLFLPCFACYKSKQLIREGENGGEYGVMYVETTKYEGWRDTDGAHAKTWRMSKLVNRWGALFFNLKEDRWYWNSYRMFFNLLEGMIIIGLPLTNDLRGLIIVVVYFIQWIFLLLQRPYRYWGMFLIEFIQMFHNVFLYMSSTLYITEGLFNAQSLISAETDGVEEMMMVLGSGMTCFHIIRVFYVGTNLVNQAFWKSQHGDAENWDTECDDKRVTKRTTREQENVAHKRLNANRGSADGSWTMKKINSKPDVRKASVALTTGANNNKKKKMFDGDDDDDEGISMVNPMRNNNIKKKKQSLKPDTDDEIGTSVVNPMQISQLAPPKEKRKNSTIPSNWASAVDPNSGNTYYYNKETHETRWTKPS